MSEQLLTYDQAMAEVKTFLGAVKGRYRLEGAGWSRWYAPPKALPRIRTQMVGMKVGHPWQEIQRQSDKDQRSVEKVSVTPP